MGGVHGRHGPRRCTLRSIVRPSSAPVRQWQGRPLGFLVACLHTHRDERFTSKAEHYAVGEPGNDPHGLLDYEHRFAAREWLLTCGMPDLDDLMQVEKCSRPSEGSEPLVYR